MEVLGPSRRPEAIFTSILPRISAIIQIQTLDINDNYTKAVVDSKALHHLLPDLIPPMNRAYTGRFFACPSPTFKLDSGRSSV